MSNKNEIDEELLGKLIDACVETLGKYHTLICEEKAEVQDMCNGIFQVLGTLVCAFIYELNGYYKNSKKPPSVKKAISDFNKMLISMHTLREKMK